MRRRDFVKAIVAVPISARTMLGQQADTKAAPHPQEPVAPSAYPRGLSEPKALITSSVPDAVATTQAHFFTEQQMATLGKLAAILTCAPKGYPSASEAGAVEFIDFLIGASPDDRKRMYQAGLDRLNAESKKEFHVPFAQ